MPEHYVTPREAARLLGVHVVTIRRWTKSGRLEAMRTPGGHRRIPRAAVDRLLHEQSTDDVPVSEPEQAVAKAAPADTTWAQHALIHTRHELQIHQNDAWMKPLDEDARQHSREAGRRLLGLLLQHVVATTTDEALWNEVRSLAHGYACQMRAQGLSLTEATQATLFFRDVLTQSTAYYPHLHEKGIDQQVVLLRKLSRFMNEIQLVITEVYEQRLFDRS